MVFSGPENRFSRSQRTTPRCDTGGATGGSGGATGGSGGGGGCAVGAGVTGGAIFALTAWVALIGMWIGAGLTDRWLDAPPVSAPTLMQP